MHRVRMLIIACCIVGVHTNSTSQEAIFPGLQGLELLEALKNNYTPASRLGITAAKDTVYLVIERQDGLVEGIYSGFTMTLPDGVDPSQWLYDNGAGINLEHVYPQSKGADEGTRGHSDMHHLFPARALVNSTRANNPFDDIPDNQTSKWFRNDVTLENMPTSDIDAYSEFRSGLFEPRESVKGNIARAVFYFYTIYQDEADAADPDFFNSQRETLCIWHLADPVDGAEMARSAKVAEYQDGKENPFILDCTAVLRAWCPELEGECVTATQDPGKSEALYLVAYADREHIIVSISSTVGMDASLQISDMTGRIVHRASAQIMTGTNEFTLETNMHSGLYVVSCLPADSSHSAVVTKCLIQ